MKTLRQRVIRLASERPDLRSHLLPLLKEASPTCDILIRDDFPGFLDRIEDLLKKEIPHTGSWRCWKAKEVPNSMRRPVMTIDCQLSYPNRAPIDAEVKVFLEQIGSHSRMLFTSLVTGNALESDNYDPAQWSLEALVKRALPHVAPNNIADLDAMMADINYLDSLDQEEDY